MAATPTNNVTNLTVSVLTRTALKSMALGKIFPMAMSCVVPIQVRFEES